MRGEREFIPRIRLSGRVWLSVLKTSVILACAEGVRLSTRKAFLLIPGACLHTFVALLDSDSMDPSHP
jgi:hypothetical protein